MDNTNKLICNVAIDLSCLIGLWSTIFHFKNKIVFSPNGKKLFMLDEEYLYCLGMFTNIFVVNRYGGFKV
jgi:hypothetical protein